MVTSFQVGDIVSHQYRKQSIYVIVELQDPDSPFSRVTLQRVKNQEGYPLTADKLHTSTVNLIKFIDHVKGYEDTKKLKELRSKIRADKYQTRQDRYNARCSSRDEFDKLPEAVRDEFHRMAAELQPERLYCDGELSHAQAMRKKKDIITRWNILQNQHHIVLSPDQVEQW